MKSVDIDLDEVAIDKAILDRLEHARKEHPEFAHGKYQALGVIIGEVEELIYAVEHESDTRAANEALDVIAVCIRYLCKEYEHDV